MQARTAGFNAEAGDNLITLKIGAHMGHVWPSRSTDGSTTSGRR